MLGWSVILATLFLGKSPRGMLPVFMMVGPVFVVPISYMQLQMIEIGQILNIYGMIHDDPWHFISSLPFHGNSVNCVHRHNFE